MKRFFKVWRKLHKVLRITNLTLTALIGATPTTLAVIATQGVIIPAIVYGVLGGYRTLETTIMEGMNI